MSDFDLEKQAPFLERINQNVYKGCLKASSVCDGAYDANWLSEHNLFYSTQHLSRPFVKRVFLSEETENSQPAGFAHIRPVSDGAELSETYLVPPKDLRSDHNVYIKCHHEICDYGHEVGCVPFIVPDTLFGMCAQASVWICLRILNELSPQINSLSIPQIQSLAKGHPFADQEGLPVPLLPRLFRMCKCMSFYFGTTSGLSDDELEFCLYAYIESNLPVIIGVEVSDLEWWSASGQSGYHVLVGIGHTIADGKIDGYIFHDESRFPYQRLTLAELKKAWHVPSSERILQFKKDNNLPDDFQVREAVVAVPPEVSKPFQIAYRQYREILLVLAKQKIWRDTIFKSSTRPYLASSQELLAEHILDSKTFNEFYRRFGIETLSSSYYWVIEMLSAKRKNYRGFFAVDATGESDLRIFCSELDNKMIVFAEGRVAIIGGETEA